ncbi:7-carboxy-7-deazaguanine synthase [Verrucomicrobium sp. GAS474]|uniref:radical SAM protein n=1 Tax=Verrucomicrobium sp. GAS474 TaxID=1882831 RepID=UPI00087B80F1|nr:radical SAM protein [Verrucomicrobium sp. GAS474]SDT96882.1 7-carboxy-7-deazaguanine synthase [Verrucomicrobium sp. GAS474]
MSSDALPDLSGLNLTINEVFHSIQGESTFAGRPCLFIRLTACDLRCTYCDTEYAFYEGNKRPVADLLAEALAHPCQLVEVTGGEPLLQKNVHPLMTALCDAGKTVLLETSGAHDIGPVDFRVHRIMDLKCPSSGESGRNLAANRPLLTARDEVKFVAGTEEDCLWALAQIRDGLKENGGDGWPQRVAAILFSPVFGKIDLRFLADTLLAAPFPSAVAEKIRLQVQLHKLIWEPTARGV